MSDTRRKPRLQTERDVLAFFEAQPFDDSIRDYLRFHANRYLFLLEKVDSLAPARVLDIGPSFQTSLMRELYPNAVIDTLGFDDSRFPRRENDQHLTFDLNDARGSGEVA